MNHLAMLDQCLLTNSLDHKPDRDRGGLDLDMLLLTQLLQLTQTAFAEGA